MRLNTAQRLALNIDSHIVIDAGAGTGKTSTIVHRVIEHYLTEDQRATRILPTPERPARLPGGMITAPSSERIDLREWGGLLPGEVVLLTFTNRAADEMRDRLRNDIAGLKPGPAGSDETGRSDPRIRDSGFGEQLLTLLEDAPIGTIDSFLNRLVSPYRGHLGDSLSRENVSDAGRAMLVESALNSLWRLPSSTSRIGEAVDAGLPSHMAPDILAARDRIASHYSGRWTAAKVLRSLVDKSVFIEEASRSLMEGGRFSADLLHQQIMASIDPSDINQHTELVHSIISRFCDLVKDNSAVLALDGWPVESRMACLDRLSANLPDDPWEQLVWLGHVLECTLNRGGYLRNGTLSFLPYNNLPSDDWVAGIDKVSSIKDRTTKEHVKSGFKAVSDDLKSAWSTNHGLLILHFTKLAMFLDSIRPPASPDSWRPTVTTLPEPLPERIDSRPQDYGFSLEAEVRNLEDLYLVHHGFKGILQKLKERDEVHDFDDIQRLAGDLLLANCPSACRSYYPESLQNTLDSISDSPWTDDHIHMTFDQLDSLEANPSLAGEAASDLGAIRNDLQYRFELLRSIRRRYRAFIIDEAQDNSPLQWRLLARLWGERRVEEGEPETPDTPWQPTVCYVGDVKQSIYAFRQAEVTGFLEYARQLMLVNDHEFASVPALVRKPSLRRDSHSRDPRNAHALTIAKASEHMEKGGRDLVPWIPFDATDRNLPAPGEPEVNLRRRGMIALQVNYRTSGGLLRAMNEWWEDILSHRHRLFPAADFYATPQTLFANPDKQDDSGTIEWLCPLSTGGEQDPPTDLTVPLDPFGPGPPDSLERQAQMVALRVRSLILGEPVRVRASDGGWHEIEADEPVEPCDIMILLPTRPNIRDTVIRHLRDYGVPAQADREGGLLDRPAVHALEGLLQLVARPSSRHSAAWVARSPIIGMDDSQLQSYLDGSRRGENLLQRLSEHCPNDRLRTLVDRWIELASCGRIIDLLEETIDHSDLLVGYHDPVSIQDVEHFVEIVRGLSLEVGGDPIVLADRIRNLREDNSGAIEAVNTPPSDAVRVMTIHSAKGLEAKVVFLLDLFSNRQTNMTNENMNRLIVSPEMFSGNPKPWPGKGSPQSAVWNHVSWLHRARKSAEARRLLYVGATRAEERLVIVGSPRKTSWEDGNGLVVPWTYDKSLPQLGQMWLESLRQGSLRRSEAESPWIDEQDVQDPQPFRTRGVRNFNPVRMVANGSIGDAQTLDGLLILHHPDCFETEDSVLTPLQQIERMDAAARSSGTEAETSIEPRSDSSPRISLSPNRLPVFDECPRRQWYETRGGLIPDPIMPSENPVESTVMPNKVDPATFGTIFHRVLEIGLGNPGLDGQPSAPLLPSWTVQQDDRINDSEIHEIVFNELLPPDADKARTAELVIKMAGRVSSGPLGAMIRKETIRNHSLEALRTEMPFHISIDVDTDSTTRHRWSPDGNISMTSYDSAVVEMSGIIDLVVCSVSSDGQPAIRAVDLKTEDAGSIDDDSPTGLIEALGSEEAGPVNDSEMEILSKHGLQLALYYRALKSIEDARAAQGIPSRQVLPPAILIGVTGRMVEYPEDMLADALSNLDALLERSARMSLSSSAPLSLFERLPNELSEVCERCPFSRGLIPICGPQDA